MGGKCCAAICYGGIGGGAAALVTKARSAITGFEPGVEGIFAPRSIPAAANQDYFHWNVPPPSGPQEQEGEHAAVGAYGVAGTRAATGATGAGAGVAGAGE